MEPHVHSILSASSARDVFHLSESMMPIIPEKIRSTRVYAALQKLAPLILEHQGKETMRGMLADTVARVNSFELGGYVIEAKLNGRDKSGIAGGLIIQTGPDEFIVAGKGLDVLLPRR